MKAKTLFSYRGTLPNWIVWICTLLYLLITTAVQCTATTTTLSKITFSETTIAKEEYLTNQYANRGVTFDTDGLSIEAVSMTSGAVETNHVVAASVGGGSIAGHFVNVSDTDQRIALSSFKITVLVQSQSSGTITVQWNNLDGTAKGTSSGSWSSSKNIDNMYLPIEVQVPNNTDTTCNNNNVTYFNIWSSENFVLDEMILIPCGTPIVSPMAPPTVVDVPMPTTPMAPDKKPEDGTNYNAEILFRSLKRDAKDGSWGSRSLNLPGFDHVAVLYRGKVYESHPGYANGTYTSADGTAKIPVRNVSGVQNFHSRETFLHCSTTNVSPVEYFDSITITMPDGITMDMINKIIDTVNSTTGFVSFATIDDVPTKLRPVAQKGGNRSFTNCGLIEWAAELAGVNNGRGFIPNELEGIEAPNETFPLLSPNLLYDAMKNPFNASQYLLTYLDPVDYIVTDPLGRRSGFVNNTRFQEIPSAVATPRGDVEYLVVSNPIPGEYKLTVHGIPGQKGIASVQVAGRPAVTVRTTGRNDTVQERTTVVPVVAGSRGDVNGDGVINQTDLTLLKQKIPMDVDGFANTGDMNADSLLNQTDVDMLERYLNVSHVSLKPSECPPSDSCNAGFFFQRFRMRKTLTILGTQRCIERCVYQVAIRMGKRLKWQCGRCT